MTREDIIKLARDAGLVVYEGHQDRVLFEGSIVAGLQRLVELAAAKEREACAWAAEEVGNRDKDNHAWDAAAVIRARGNA